LFLVGAGSMVDFSFADILIQLALAARWTIALSIVAFVCGGCVGGYYSWHASLSRVLCRT